MLKRQDVERTTDRQIRPEAAEHRDSLAFSRPGASTRLPDFLIIGAMKAGTTTLYRDLLANPAVYFPAVKEPDNLLDDDVFSKTGRAAYCELFRRAKQHQICGEASTGYSKIPHHPGVPGRARALLGANLKIIYIVREPVARIVSHHYHSYSTGKFGPDINVEVRREPRLLDYTRYAMQIEPWIESFGRSNVLILMFEEFVASRRATIRQVSEFLRIPPRDEAVDENAVHNRSDGKPVPSHFWRRIRRSGIYRRFLQRCLPAALRSRLLHIVGPKAPPRPDPPSNETIEFIRESLRDDMDALSAILGRSGPIWPTAEQVI